MAAHPIFLVLSLITAAGLLVNAIRSLKILIMTVNITINPANLINPVTQL